MKEFKGTKGEWEFHCGENIGVSSKNPLLIIADVELDKDIPTDQQIANAKLIAAAPELLEALQECIFRMAQQLSLSQVKVNKTEFERGITIAEQAISKALD